MKTNYHIKAFLFSLTMLASACSDFIAIDPPKTESVSKTVFSSDGAAMLAVRGVYTLMMTNQSFTWGGLEEFTGIGSDELISYSTRLDNLQFYQNSITPKNSYLISVFWAEPFKYISNANAILEGLNESTGMSSSMKAQVEGEAKFIRAFCYFYLVNLFGDVPYLQTSDYNVNATASRTPASEVYTHIIADLQDASNLLSNDYSFAGNERIQPNKFAAMALLSRTYLYQKEWQKASDLATQVITSPNFALKSDLNEVFLPNSTETIWQLRPVIPGTNTPQGQLFILLNPPNSSSYRVTMTSYLSNAFETGDNRKTTWTNTYTSGSNSWNYIFKYKRTVTTSVQEYSTVLRLAEVYLIRAEARAQLNDITGAQEDLNVIRKRAGLSPTSANASPALLDAILRERRVELCGEFGHRWLDLKRTGKATEVLSPIKQQWQSTDVLYPIPESERLLNTNLTQNEGY